MLLYAYLLSFWAAFNIICSSNLFPQFLTLSNHKIKKHQRDYPLHARWKTMAYNTPVQLSQAPILDDQPNSAYPLEDLRIHYTQCINCKKTLLSTTSLQSVKDKSQHNRHNIQILLVFARSYKLLMGSGI